MNSRLSQSFRVAVVGGGLSGLAAGCALAEVGFPVSLFERRPYLGGRASSYEHPGTGEVVDNCQHVLLGCCTNLVEFYRRLEIADRIRWYDRLTFLEPGGRASVVEPSPLPAPFHTAPSFLRARCLKARDKLSISTAMASLVSQPPEDRGESFLTWLRRHHQSGGAIERFWRTILVSALNEDLDRISCSSAAQVMRESFLKSAEAGRMGVPTVPLTELYAVAGDYIRARGGEVHLRTGVESFHADSVRVGLSVGGVDVGFDAILLAVPFDVLARMLPAAPEAQSLREQLAHFETSPITGIHLWLDRQITDLDHAILLDRTIQWMFHKSKLLSREARPFDHHREQGGACEVSRAPSGCPRNGAPATEECGPTGSARETGGGVRTPADSSHDRADSAAPFRGSYVELVVSSSKALVAKSKSDIIALALDELREFFPAAREAKLLKSTVVKEVNATYSPQPGVDAYRPSSPTVWPRVFLAGDWTATGWPATMEGAVRSGYLAAEAIVRASGVSERQFLVPDLSPTGLMRLFN
ncbi:MAG TPA: hydroxysqualene dehydroxylase HpnE [Terriglobales bacterium]|nr:hydroxysqualene dehydroxylase HpnE [Terriglobales bacterium]